jgi:protein-S-isoprenylcysteine O-methyltransferase Ste14
MEDPMKTITGIVLVILGLMLAMIGRSTGQSVILYFGWAAVFGGAVIAFVGWSHFKRVFDSQEEDDDLSRRLADKAKNGGTPHN